MGGAYGLVLVVFSALVFLFERHNPEFVPAKWMPAINLVMMLGIAWLLVAVLLRFAKRFTVAMRDPNL